MSVAFTSLDESSFFDFVDAPAPSVVFLSLHPLHPFNHALPEQLQRRGIDGARFGSVTLSDLFVERATILQFLAREKAKLADRHPGVFPGYYLFRDGELLGYDAGLPGRGELNQVLRGAAVGAALYRFTGQSSALFDAVLAAAHGPAASRAAHTFAEALRAPRRGPRSADTGRAAPSETELGWAYGVLGVEPTATDAEVNFAWRKRRAACHPDHAGTDRNEFARRSQLSRELNRARDVIFAHRERRASAA